MKTLYVLIEFEENPLVEGNLINKLNSDYNVKDFKVLPKTEHLKNNESFKKLVKYKKEAARELDRFINDNRE
tara:strand:+ start:1704 stop:1919 length:216 start_codon:yes stop_codon:yes gene_type:complete